MGYSDCETGLASLVIRIILPPRPEVSHNAPENEDWGWQSSSALLQVLQKCPVGAASEVLLELYDSYPSIRPLISNRYESTSPALFDCHLGHHG